MAIWAIADLHLAFGNPGKSMEAFGPKWKNYAEKLRTAWEQHVNSDDLVLIAGDISWAMKLKKALIDLEWIDALPGQKLLLRGNHDYWWPTSSKLRAALPPSISFIHNNAFNWNDVTIGGTRLWDTSEYSFEELIEFVENPLARKKTASELEKQKEENERIFQRELGRLRMSLEKLSSEAKTRIALTHYPPIGPPAEGKIRQTLASRILEEFQIDICIFGHLHNVKEKSLEPTNRIRGVKYIFTSADYLDFCPIKVL